MNVFLFSYSFAYKISRYFSQGEGRIVIMVMPTLTNPFLPVLWLSVPVIIYTAHLLLIPRLSWEVKTIHSC